MFPLFDTIGHFIRSSFAVGFAAFWGWSSVWLNGAKLGDLRLIGLAGVLVIVGLVGAAISAGFYTLIMFLREDRKPKREVRKAPVEDDTPPAFDAEAIIARHIAARNALRQRRSVAAPRFRAAVHRPLGAASSFGRKLG